MTFGLLELALIIALALVAGAVGLSFGIFFLAPRLSRLADRSDEDTGAESD